MSDAATFERCMSAGGVAVFPSDTVYGLACDPSSSEAVRRLYAMKRRQMDKPSAVMFFDRDLALDALPEIGLRTRARLERLLPGGVTLLLDNPRRRWPLTCGADAATLGLRVPAIDALHTVRRPVLQSSANRAGEPDARRLDEIPAELLAEADLVLDGGELPGIPSTVVDLRSYEQEGLVEIVREGLVPGETVRAALL